HALERARCRVHLVSARSRGAGVRGGDKQLRELQISVRSSQGAQSRKTSPGRLGLLLLIAGALSACGEKPQQQAAAPPSVTVAQPVKRTVTDWDEFTGRFEAVEEVQIRPRVGGYVTNVEFKDGDMVHAGGLLYVIDSRPFEAVAEQADGQLA